MSIHFPKGEGFKIIKSRAEASVNDSVYILPLDEKTATIIIRSQSGELREVGITLPENLATVDLFDTQGSLTSEGNVYLKYQIDASIKGLGDSVVNDLSPRIKAVEDKNISQDEDLQAEIIARTAGDANLSEQITTEINNRNIAESSISQGIADLQGLVTGLEVWRDGLTNADTDNIVDTLTELLQVMQNVPEGTDVYGVLASKVNISSIVNNLTMSAANAPLSAQQGLVLKGFIDGLQAAITQEVSDRKASGSALQSQIGSNAAAISQETADRKSAVSALQTAFDTVVPQLLFKPTATTTAPDIAFKYIPLLDASGNTKQMLAGDLGKNIANSALTSVSGAGLTLAAPWTLNAANYPYYITGLVDKSTDTSFNQLMVQNASGQVARSNGASTYIASVTAMTDAQKLTLRQKLLLSTEAYSTGQAVISSVNPPIILQKPGYTQYVSIIGSNLFIDPTSTQAQIKIVDSSGNETLVNNFTTTQSNPNILTFPITDGQLVTEDFTFKIFNNGVWSAANSQAVLRVRQSITQLAMPNVNWTVQDYTGAVPPDYTGSLANGACAKTLNSTGFHIYSALTNQPVYSQGDFSITPDLMSKGILLILDINLIFPWDNNGNYYLDFGLTTLNSLQLNRIFDFDYTVNILGALSMTPSNISKTINLSQSSGVSLSLKDQIFLIFSKGQLTFVIKGQGVVYTQSIDMSKTYFIKCVLNSANNSGLNFNSVININSIYQLY